MKEKTVTEIITKQVFTCETCGREHDGKLSIFRCPEHGEFCNPGYASCCIFRDVWKSEGEYRGYNACCPICGWTTFDWDVEVLDERWGEKPSNPKEIQSFQYNQKLVLQWNDETTRTAKRRMIEVGITLESLEAKK